jgi:hypothetical protein
MPAIRGEEPNEDSGPPTRCNPGPVTRLIPKLSPEMAGSIEKFKLSKMLNMKLTGLIEKLVEISWKNLLFMKKQI